MILVLDMFGTFFLGIDSDVTIFLKIPGSLVVPSGQLLERRSRRHRADVVDRWWSRPGVGVVEAWSPKMISSNLGISFAKFRRRIWDFWSQCKGDVRTKMCLFVAFAAGRICLRSKLCSHKGWGWTSPASVGIAVKGWVLWLPASVFSMLRVAAVQSLTDFIWGFP
jgi:hypothetical protein